MRLVTLFTVTVIGAEGGDIPFRIAGFGSQNVVAVAGGVSDP